MRAPIHSKKHYVQTTLSTVSGVSVLNTVLVDSVETPTAVNEVVEGALVKAIFIERWIINSANDATDMFIIAKYPQGAAAPSFAQTQALGDFEGKKNILFVHQGLTANDGVGNPMNQHYGWQKIPKGKQRFGLGDRLIVSAVNMHATQDSQTCGIATYKEYT